MAGCCSRQERLTHEMRSQAAVAELGRLGIVDGVLAAGNLMPLERVRVSAGGRGLDQHLGRRQLAHAVQELLDIWDRRVREVVGDVVFGVDADTMESVVLDLLRSRGLTLGLAESVTGGLVAGRLTNVAGSSDVLRGSIVSYASEVKFDVLGVTPGPVVSESVAVEMATGARRVLGADVGLALTGVAGPADQDGVKPGTLCVGLALPDGSTQSRTLQLPGVRDQMRQLSVISALDFLRRAVPEK